jgi:hypothetical protein
MPTALSPQSLRFTRRNDRVEINGQLPAVNYTAIPPISEPNAASYHEKLMGPNPWGWNGNTTYNDTKFTFLLRGDIDT